MSGPMNTRYAALRRHRSRVAVALVSVGMAASSLALPAATAARAASAGATPDSSAGASAATAATAATAAGTSAIVVDAQRLESDILAARDRQEIPDDVYGALLSRGRAVLEDVSAPREPRLCAAESQLLVLQTLAMSRAPYFFTTTLQTDILNLRSVILSHSGTQACGGVASSGPAVTAPVAKIVSSTTRQLTMHVVFPAPVFARKQGNGVNYVQLQQQGFGNGASAIGTPELPSTTESFAVPLGASASVTVLGSSSYTLAGPLLWPTQPSGAASAADGQQGQQLDPPPAFTVNPKSYRSAAVLPSRLARAGAVGSMRGLKVASVSLAGATYVPARRTLRVYTSIDIRVSFVGRSTGIFGNTNLTSPWNTVFQNLYQAKIVNWQTVSRYLVRVPFPRLCGEEMLVITSSALAPAANTFAADRTAHGVLSRVFVTDGPNGIGTSALAVWATIDNAYRSRTCIRPSYVTLLGDTGQVPTFEISLGYHADTANPLIQDPNFYEDPVATDMPFGFLHQGFAFDLAHISDFNQDVLVGRIPAGDLQTAVNEVNALLDYDDNPPSSPAFYKHVTATAFFQPCASIQTNCHDSNGNPVTPGTQDTQSFLRSSEFTAGLAAVASKTVNRVTSDESDNDTVAISPSTFDNGQPITPGLTFDSSSSDMTSQIQTDVNNGTFLLWHSDHGYTNGVGWYEPPFREYGDVDGLSDAGKLPVIWSSDCDSGKFDAPSYPNVTGAGGTPTYGPYLMESRHAAGFVGASRESPIYNDGYLLEGMGANLFPEEGNIFLGIFGVPPRKPVVQLGALLDAAKNHMVSATGSDLSTNIGAIGTVLEYNDFGDPSTVIRRDRPRFILSQQVSAVVSKGLILVRTRQAGLAGGVVTLVRDGRYVGRGVLNKGQVTIQSPLRFTSLAGLDVLVAGDGVQATTVSLTRG